MVALLFDPGLFLEVFSSGMSWNKDLWDGKDLRDTASI